MTPATPLTLRELDAEIARLRGWSSPGGSWFVPSNEHAEIQEWWRACVYSDAGGEPWSEHAQPPFSSRWALAGPLLAETGGMLRARNGDRGGPWYCEAEALGAGWFGPIEGAPPVARFVAPTPCEAIARAWCAWKVAQS